jgi:hypothetical protein
MQETGELRCPIVSGQRPIQSFARNPETCLFRVRVFSTVFPSPCKRLLHTSLPQELPLST